VEGARRLVRSDLDQHGRVRFHQVWSRPQKSSTTSRAVLCFAVASFVAAGIAGFFGAMITKNAPVHGGHTIQLSQGEEK
jgi:hypothetical protein